MENQTFTFTQVRTLLGVGDRTLLELLASEPTALVTLEGEDTRKLVTRASVYQYMDKAELYRSAPVLDLPDLLTTSDIATLLGTSRDTAKAIIDANGARWLFTTNGQFLSRQAFTTLLGADPIKWSEVAEIEPRQQPRGPQRSTLEAELAELKTIVTAQQDLIGALTERVSALEGRPRTPRFGL